MKTVLALLIASTLGATTASAETRRGLVMGAAELPKSVRTSLDKGITTARVQHRAAFEAVGDIIARAPAIHAQRRGRYAPYSLLFQKLGPEALMAVVERITFDDRRPADLPPAAWSALRAGLLEAAGAPRKAELEPLFVTVLNGTETDALVLRAAAASLGQLATDTAAQKLVEVASTAGPKQGAVIAGMGECRRLAVASFLAAELDRLPDDARARVVMESLRDTANAWAWKTPAIRTHAAEEQAIRDAAAQALWRAFLRYDDEARETARKSLVVVGYPDTLEWAEAARAGAPVELAKAIDRLQASFKAIAR